MFERTATGWRGRARRLLRGLGILVVFFLLLTAWAAYRIRQHNQYRVDGLHIQMTRTEVEQVMRRVADCETHLGRLRALYFEDPAWRGTFPCPDLAPQYSSPEDLPAPYSAVLVVLDRQARVSAFVHIGEGPLHTRRTNETRGTIGELSLRELE